MGCLLGCFGGRKKERNHGSSPLIANKQKVPHTLRHISPAWNRAASSASASIPIKAGTRYEDLLTVRQARKSGPVRSADSIPLQGHKTSEQQNEHVSADPWSQLDDLEEELEDLRKQIDKESEDARKIREEVHFLKSCGTLQKTPSELRKRAHHSERQQNNLSGNEWHSWLVPSYSPNAKAMVECSKAASWTPTSAKESHGFSDRVHTQTVSKSSPIRLLGSLQSTPRPDDANTAVYVEEKTEIGEHKSLQSQYKMVLPLRTVPCRDANSDLSLNGQLSGTIINMSGDCRTDDMAKERTARSFIATEETKERMPSAEEIEADTTSADIGSQQQRLGISPSNKDKDSHLRPSSTNDMHVFRSAALPPILESGLSMEDDSTSHESERFCKEEKRSMHFHVDKHGNNTSVTTSPGTASQSSSVSSGHNYATTRPVIGSKSVSFTDSYADNDTTDGYTYGDTAESSYSSYSNSSCIQTGEGSCTATDSYSSSTIGEEAVSDGSCFPMNQTQQQRYPFSKDDSSATSSVNAKSEDDFNTSSDAMSHVSTVSSSERDKGSRHGHADCMDKFSQTPSFAHATDLCSLKTPKSLPHGLVTPTLTMQGLHARLRSKPTSSVLMPVENVSQWKELKQRSDYPDLGTSKSGISRSPPALVRRIFDYSTQDVKGTSGEDRSNLPMHAGKDEDSLKSEGLSEICVDMSLSHWLKPQSQKEATEISRSSDSTSAGADACSPAPPWTVDQTPIQWQRSASGYSTDRPVLGAATADYSATAKKRPEWDGKGIPNTTTKYKEDQTVNWHGTPFEVRLERALDKQGIVLQKKLFGVTPSTT